MKILAIETIPVSVPIRPEFVIREASVSTQSRRS